MKLSQMGLASFGLSLAMALSAGTLSQAGEKDGAALSRAPAVVQAAVKKSLGDKKMEEFGKASLGGKIIYEVGFKVGTVDHSYIISEAGELLQEEADVKVSKLPAAVTATVKKAEPKGEISEAALATAGDKKFYEVDVKVGKEIHDIKVSLDGTLLSDDIEKPLKDDDTADKK